MIAKLKRSPYFTLVTDGWTIPNQESIVNFVVTSPVTKLVIWKSIATGSAKHTAKYMADELKR